MIHDVWIEDDTREEWVCRWVCNTCGAHGPWADTKNRDRVQEAKLAHAEDTEAHANGDPSPTRTASTPSSTTGSASSRAN